MKTEKLKVTYYRSVESIVELTYRKGVLIKIEVLKNDLVGYEGLRYNIPLHEKDLNERYFFQVPDPVFMRHFTNPELQPIKAVLFLVYVMLLGLLSMLTYAEITLGNAKIALMYSSLFVFVFGWVYWRNGNR